MAMIQMSLWFPRLEAGHSRSNLLSILPVLGDQALVARVHHKPRVQRCKVHLFQHLPGVLLVRGLLARHKPEACGKMISPRWEEDSSLKGTMANSHLTGIMLMMRMSAASASLQVKETCIRASPCMLIFRGLMVTLDINLRMVDGAHSQTTIGQMADQEAMMSTTGLVCMHHMAVVINTPGMHMALRAQDMLTQHHITATDLHPSMMLCLPSTAQGTLISVWGIHLHHHPAKHATRGHTAPVGPATALSMIKETPMHLPKALNIAHSAHEMTLQQIIVILETGAMAMMLMSSL